MKRKSDFNGTVALQKTYKRAHKRQVKVYFEDAPIQTEDEKFLYEVVDYIKQNISTTNLTVKKLSGNMNMSRAWLYKKVLLLTGKSPVDFIRAIRLQKAVHLLENTQMKVSEVASEVGLETPQYFSKLFKNEYDMLPSDYIHFARHAKAQVILNAYGLAGTIKKASVK